MVLSLEVPEICPAHLHGVFGMVEMEIAALIILRKAIDQRCSWDVAVTLADFGERREQTGFLNLLCFGWLAPNTHNPSAHGEFTPTPEFIVKVATEGAPD